MDPVFVYITAASGDEAHRIARALVEERLAACVNMLDGMTSVYRWNGAVEQASEVVLIAKTRADRFDRLAARIRELHSYCGGRCRLSRLDPPGGGGDRRAVRMTAMRAE
jgi:periplasmic divalent cation tolerance protein